MSNNECLIDWFRFSVSNSEISIVSEKMLGIPIEHFATNIKKSPFPTYDNQLCFANIEIHYSNRHSNILVNLSGKGCRQYEEYMSKSTGWHWQAFIENVLNAGSIPTRIDLALDIFDDTTPSVSKLQDYIKRGQLSTSSHKFKEINSGRILDGVLTGFTIYIGSSPQILRIYDKKQEVFDNTGETSDLETWIRWELELTNKKAELVCSHIAKGTPLNLIIKGILSSHYSFKTQPKGTKIDFHNKARWNTMRWWNNFVGNIPKIPLRVKKEKLTLQNKKAWIEKSTTKSRAMLYEVYKSAYGEDYANQYIQEELSLGRKKLTEIDQTMIEQSINELLGEKEI